MYMANKTIIWLQYRIRTTFQIKKNGQRTKENSRTTWLE
jgi:ribosomal protein S13